MNAINTNGANPLKGLSTIFEKIKSDPKVPLIVAGALAITFFIAAMFWLQGTDYRPVYTNLSDKDGGEIVTQLSQMNIPYQLSDDGSMVKVPADKVHEVRLKLAQQGLPKGGNVGFELLDQEKFGLSQFNEQINYQRALEGELARTIESLGIVQRARVHLAIPKPSLFVREQKDPTASVTLNLQNGRKLDDGQVAAIVHMISSSVSGLSGNNVTIVDQSGNLLTQPEGISRDLNLTQLNYVQSIENRYKKRIESIITPLVGRGNVQAQVTAQVNFARSEETAEEYKPNQPPNESAVRSKQSSRSEQNGQSLIGGVPGALSNQPTREPKAPIDRANDKNNPRPLNNNHNSRLDETTNYEIDRRIRHTQHQIGSLQRLSVAIIVNYADSDRKENDDSLPLTNEKLAQIKTLAQEAMGFSEQRGDSLYVVNAPFEPQDAELKPLEFWQQPIVIANLLEIGRYLLLSFLAWLFWRLIIKPQLRKKREAAESAKTAADLAIIREAERAAQQKIEHDEAMRQEQKRQRINAEMQTKRLREMVQKNPRVMAMVVRNWMSEEL
ncbi:flagellar basal-body MS-ring/collar protein FliF [Arsenophonus sp.]|uniref:flagellar basal-body MS-ring/collar protein FliF n=1 Tax=Arsenophonus sp. TaxID=1872640 RepID=UPI00286129DE|nr:flagellar basal-body MS-ring/collar protein FliF [Arsenophonus sp.]MDR5615826.1 flagellar basal-body MS-ring/collar protein FliF [Arsenophonus sp.]